MDEKHASLDVRSKLDLQLGGDESKMRELTIDVDRNNAGTRIGMTSEGAMRKQALVAGAMYAGMILTTSVWYRIAVGFMEGRDAAGMLAALQAGQAQFEFSIFLGAAGFIFWVLLALALGRLMRPAGQSAVVALLTFVCLGAVMGLVAVAHEMDALAMLRAADGAAGARDVALAMESFRSVFVVSMVFSALWLIPEGWLVIRCGFLPRVLGVALIVGSVFYFGNFVGPLFDAGYQSTTVGRVVGVVSGVPSLIGEIGTCVSLLVYGLRRAPVSTVLPPP